MHYYLYEIRNNINGKIYIGVHKTKVLADGYMGSGKVLKYAIKKYGLENFTKTILETFETQEEMFAREKEIVTEEFLSREDTYNLRVGGLGGFDFINADKSEKYYEIRRNAAVTRNQNGKNPFFEYHKTVSSEQKSKILLNSVAIKKELGTYRNTAFLGKTHSKETKKKIGEKTSLKQTGEKNSQFGTIWITNGIENKKIRKHEAIPSGWLRGRNKKPL